MWKCRKFSHQFCPVLMWSPKNIKKSKRSSRWWRHRFLWFYVDLKKKKSPSSESCNFSPRFLRHTRARRRELQLSTVFGGKQKRRFLAGNKIAGFWREKKRRNSQNFSAKMPEKISHFFALIGNTGVDIKNKLPDNLTKIGGSIQTAFQNSNFLTFKARQMNRWM